MAARNPLGHHSASISAVYFLCKYISLVFSEKEFAKRLELDSDILGLSQFSWPHISHYYTDEQNEDTSSTFVVALGARTSNGSSFSKFEDDDAFVSLEYINLRKNINETSHVHLYPPYDKCLEIQSRRLFSGKDVVFPFGTIRGIDWLRSELCAGNLNSYLTDHHGVVREIPSSFWLSAHSEDVMRHNVSTLVYVDDKPLFGRVSMKLADIDNIFANLEGSTINTNAQIDKQVDTNEENTSRRGRPKVYDVNLFHAEAATLIHEEGYPESLAKFVEKVRDRYERAGHPNGRPGEDWAEEKLRPTWRMRQRPSGKGVKLN